MDYNIIYEGNDDEEIEYRVLYFQENDMYTMEIRDIHNDYFGFLPEYPDAIGVALFLLHREDFDLLSEQEEYMHHGALKLCKKIPRDRLLMSKFVSKNDVSVEYGGTITPKTESLEIEEDEEKEYTETKKVYIISKVGEETEQNNFLKGFFDIAVAEKFMTENMNEGFVLKELDFSEFVILTEKYKGFNLFTEETKSRT